MKSIFLNVQRSTRFLASSYKFLSYSLMKSNKKNLTKRLLENDSTIKISFESKFQLSKNNFMFRFLLEEDDSCLGFKTCQYINLQSIIKSTSNPDGELVSKPYHPISLDSDLGFVDFLVKIYNQTEMTTGINNGNYGIFSNYLNNLEKGQTINLTGPFGNIKYIENGFFEI